MASSAALMQGMASFDSSDAGGADAGHVTAGGITFGSVAPSFHSEMEDEQREYEQQRGRYPTNDANGKGRILPSLDDDSSSVIDQDDVVASSRLAPSSQRNQNNSSRPTSALSSQQTNSTRFPSASTQITEPSPQQRPAPKSALVGLGASHAGLDDSLLQDGRNQSGQLKNLTLDDSQDSVHYSLPNKKSAAAAGGGMGQNMTLREQEKVISEFKKENFDLKLKIHFYEQRLEKLAPDQIDLALRENIQLKVEFQSLRTELKRYKKLLLEGNRAIESLTRDRDLAQRNQRSSKSSGNDASTRERELERELNQREIESEREREDLILLEAKFKDQARELKSLREAVKKKGEENFDSEDSRAEIARLRDELDFEREAKEDALAESDELRFQLRESRDLLDQAREDNSVQENSRDRASSSALELAEKEREIEDLLQDIEQRDLDHLTAIKQLEEEYKDEVQSAQTKADKATRLLQEREADVEELADKIEILMQELAEKEQEMAADTEEVEALTHDLQKLGQQIFALEEEADEKDAKIRELDAELSAVDKEWEEKQAIHDQVVLALKEKLGSSKEQLSEISLEHDQIANDNKILLDKIDTLTARTAELDARAQADANAKRKLEDEAVEIMRALRKEEEERELETLEFTRQKNQLQLKFDSALQDETKRVATVTSELQQVKNLLSIRENDVSNLQDALNGLEMSSRRLGESHSNDRFALDLELERYKRDLLRHEEILAETRKELNQNSQIIRDKEMQLAALHSENKELATQLASQTQTRLTITDKFDTTSKNLRDTQQELNSTRDRLRAVEEDLNSGHKSLSRTETQYKQQLTERNSLLLTISQYMDKMLTPNSPRKLGAGSPNPDSKGLNNFGVFHDNLITRLKNVNLIQTSFDRRAKELEENFTEKCANLKRQQDSRFKQLDKLELAVKNANELQKQWKQKVAAKQAELESAKIVNSDLQAQVSAQRSLTSSDPTSMNKIQTLTTRASNAERRLAATQAQLESAEEKLGEARIKVGVAESKWEARLKELETRLRAAEEKVKRERQGAKERVAELADTIKNLESQVGGAKRRDHVLGEVLHENEANSRKLAAFLRRG